MYDGEIIAEFIAFINTIIKNTARNYYKKENRIKVNEISMEEISETFLSCNNDEDVFYYSINEDIKLENIFTDKKYYEAMRKLTDREKLVLKLSILEEMSAKNISKKVNISEELVWKIKSRAISKFLKNLKEN